KLKNLLIVVSTHGEGDPPDNALSFHEFLHGRRAPKLDDLRYSVLALGDTSYEFFCQTGKEFDQRLGELGGTRLHPRVDCDLDYDEPAAAWLDGVISSLNEGQEQGASSAPA
ncbi:flavodoxin domain-containing protein, partial [Bacillus haynesii]